MGFMLPRYLKKKFLAYIYISGYLKYKPNYIGS